MQENTIFPEHGSMTLPALLERQLVADPQGTAVIFQGRRISWAEFDRISRRAGAWLDAQGIGPGDRVAVWMVNRVEWLALLFGLAHVGAMLIAVNTRYRASELEHILTRSGARMLVLQLNFGKIDFPAVLREVDSKTVFALEKVAVLAGGGGEPSEVLGVPTTVFDLESHAEADCPERAKPDALAVLFPTSGTTKGPKLVMHSQHTLSMHARQMAQAYGMVDERAGVLGALPLCGALGLNAVLAAFAAAAPVALMETFDGALAAELLRTHRLTHAYGSDEMFRQILAHAPGYDPFPAAREFGYGAFQSGAAAFALQAGKRRVPMVGVYGSSELQAAFSRQPMDLPLEARIEGGGLPAMGDAQVRIRDVVTQKLLPVDVSGEIEIRAASSFVGYFNDPEASADAMTVDGYFRTGDIGRLRADGSFVFEGRSGDAIRLAGFLVNPVDIEEVLRMLPGVADAQVVAVDLVGQARCVAFVVPQPEAVLTASEIIVAAAQHMAPFKVPARVWLVDSFPTTPSPNGVKVQRSRLREDAMQRIDAGT